MPLNIERARQLMHREGVDAVIASSTPNVYYISDFWSMGMQLGCGTQSYALLPLDGEPAIVAPLNEADIVVQSGSWVKDVKYYGRLNVRTTPNAAASEITKGIMDATKKDVEQSSCDSLVAAVTSRGLQKKKIAYDTSGVTPSRYENVLKSLPEAKFVDGADLLMEIRMVKGLGEVDRIQRVTEITEKSMEDALEIARPEIMEVDLAGMYSYSVAYDGGRITHCNIGMGERSAYPNPLPTTLEARKGDLIRMTLGAVFDNYQSNISRTAVIDIASAEVKKRWKAVVDAQESALEALAPGVKVGEVYDAAQKGLGKAGLKECSASLGHGLGIECNEQPALVPGSEVELAEGMVLNVDIPYLDLGWGGLELEDTVVVTKKGFRLLTNTERTLYLL
jgi:Xaa-Pro dipeptidase